tara:strand:- start:1713 stop:3173 length:1461 start_codon:yes stop_codon:yes gene_type:complete
MDAIKAFLPQPGVIRTDPRKEADAGDDVFGPDGLGMGMPEEGVSDTMPDLGTTDVMGMVQPSKSDQLAAALSIVGDNPALGNALFARATRVPKLQTFDRSEDLYSVVDGVPTLIREGQRVSGNAKTITGTELGKITGTKLPPNALFQIVTSKNGSVKYAKLYMPPNATNPIQTGESLNENIVFTGNDGGVYSVYTNVNANNRKTQYVMIGDEKVSMTKAGKIGQFTKRKSGAKDQTTDKIVKFNNEKYNVLRQGNVDVIKINGEFVPVSELDGAEVFTRAASEPSTTAKKAEADAGTAVSTIKAARKRLAGITERGDAQLGARATVTGIVNEVTGILKDFAPIAGDLFEASTGLVGTDEQKQAVRELQVLEEDLYIILSQAKTAATGGRLNKDEKAALRKLTKLTGLNSKEQIVTRVRQIDDLLVEQLSIAEQSQEIITGQSPSAADVKANSTAFSTSAVPKPNDVSQKEWDKMTDNEKSFFEVKR